MTDLISRQVRNVANTISLLSDIRSQYNCFNPDEEKYYRALSEAIKALLTAQPEITDEQAIEHLQSTGWMQNHDREMYESGLRKQLANDNGSYDSLIPCEDTIYRQAAIETVRKCNVKEVTPSYMLIDKAEAMTELMMLPSAQPEPICVAKVTLTDEQVKEAFEKAKGEILTVLDAQPERKRGKWISKRDCRYHCSLCNGIAPKGYRWDFCPNCGADMRGEQDG